MSVSDYLISKYPLVYREYSKWVRRQIVFFETHITVGEFLCESNYHVSDIHNMKQINNALDLFESNLKSSTDVK